MSGQRCGTIVSNAGQEDAGNALSFQESHDSEELKGLPRIGNNNSAAFFLGQIGIEHDLALELMNPHILLNSGHLQGKFLGIEEIVAGGEDMDGFGLNKQVDSSLQGFPFIEGKGVINGFFFQGRLASMPVFWESR